MKCGELLKPFLSSCRHFDLVDDMSVAKPYASGWETLRLNEFISEYVEGQSLQTASYITEHQNGIILDQLRGIQNYNLSQE